MIRQHQFALSRGAAQGIWILLVLTLVVVSLVSAAFLPVEESLVLASGIAAMLVLSFPILFQRHYDLFEPLTFILLTAFIGVTLRSLYIITVHTAHVDEFLLLGQPRSILLKGSLVILVGLVAFVVGYLGRVTYVDLNRYALIRNQNWSRKRLYIVVVVFLLVAFVCTVLYLQKLGVSFTTLRSFSSRRAFIVEGAEYRYASLGYYQWGGSLSQPAFYLLLAWFALSGKRWASRDGIFTLIAGGMAMLFPFLNNSRGATAFILINSVIIWHFGRGGIRIRHGVMALVPVLLIILALTGIRQGAQSTRDVASFVSVDLALEEIVGGRNLMGVEKTSHIVDAIPERLDYEYGRTLGLWLVAPIPRTLWPEKPIIAVGQILKVAVFGRDEDQFGGGVPPGFVAELYWNLGYPGVLVGMFLFGLFLKFFHRSFRPFIFTNKNALLLYVFTLVPLAFSLPGSDFSRVVMSIFQQIIPLALALKYICRK